MKRAIALSLAQAEPPIDALHVANNAAACSNTAADTAAACSSSPAAGLESAACALSEDEFDEMCAADGDLSLKERLSKSSLSSEDENKGGEESVIILTNGRHEEVSACFSDPPRNPRKKKTKVS